MMKPVQSYRGATVTVRIDPQRNLDAALQKVRSQLEQGLRYVELRDDLLDDSELRWLAQRLPPHQTLLSLRRVRPEYVSIVEAVPSALLDFATELGFLPPELLEKVANIPSLRLILSIHTRTPNQTLSEQLQRMTEESPPQAVLKAALPIVHLGELWEGHCWRARNPAQQLFLPIAPNGTGRFRFYRLLLGDSQLLHFVREEAEAEIPDQPTAIDWQEQNCLSQSAPTSFAAILGDPVEHSRTPQHHREFFSQYGMPVLKIRVTPDDLQACDVLQILIGLGLRAAAVTSPLKGWLRESVAAHGGQWQVLADSDPQESGNTLVIDQGGTLIGAFTDGIGLRQAWQQTLLEHALWLGPEPRLAVYGGGGLLPLLQQVFAQAMFLSARTGELREHAGTPAVIPAATPAATPAGHEINVLVWSVPRGRFARNPPSWLRPRLVFDLNYAPDSPGRDYADQLGALYVDGSRFFVAQAAAQQKFWQAHLPVCKGNT